MEKKSAKKTRNPRTYRGTNLDERRAERRSRLIEAGLNVFSRDGFHAATVRSVCTQAGLTERYFYEAFDNSEQLLGAVYQHCIERLRNRVTAAIAASAHGEDPSINDMARAALQAFFGLVKDEPPLARILFIEILGVNAEMDRAYRQATFGFAALLLELAHSALPQLPTPLENEDLLAAGLVGAIIVITHRWMLSDFDQPVDAVTDAGMQIFTGTLRQIVQNAQ